MNTENQDQGVEKEQKDVKDSQAVTTKKTTMADILHDKQHKELVFYLSIAIFFLELIVGGVAFFYGIIHAEPGVNGGPPQFQFPWLAYGLAAIIAPAALLLIVHLAGVGLFRSLQKKNPQDEEVWRQNLPLRLQKVYAIIQGAPTIVLFLGVIFLGVALFYVDGAISILLRIGEALLPYWPWIIGGTLITICLISFGKGFFKYRTRRMEQEYAFRREVFDRTGQILVDKGVVPLPPAYDVQSEPAYAIASKVHDTEALPPSSVDEVADNAIDESQTKSQNEEVADDVEIIANVEVVIDKK